jgi:hypothetical protein
MLGAYRSEVSGVCNPPTHALGRSGYPRGS